ncbi:MAG: ATP-binding protein, partial [Candidatus Didemnitutus sp.]|nr:ATP-binding protein [Candidatus Didemnitutus sp.]
GSLFVFHDVTELRRLESMRHDFVANVSHELRTPLSLIASAVETLIDGAKDDPEARDRFLGIADRHAARLGLLIEDLLLLSAIDSGRIELNVQPLLLGATAQEVADDLGPAAEERQVKLVNSVDEDIWVRADALRLRQIFSNLIDNAIKHGRERGRVEISAQAAGDGWVEVAVRDDGPGILPEVRARVFERFFRVEKSRARQQGGTGLGLAIVKNLVFAHGGEVRVESPEQQGTVFYFKLPMTTAAEAVADLVPGQRHPRSGR